MSERLLGGFPGLSATTEGGETVLTGNLPDQSALHGVLAELEALGLELLAFSDVPTENAGNVEAVIDECFCGCGRRIEGVRLRATNATGWRLNTELVEWMKFDTLPGEVGAESLDERRRFIDDGRSDWLSLSSALHEEQPPAMLDETNAVRWAKFSRKSRRKLSRKLERDQEAPNPFDLPTSSLDELRDWIRDRTRPAWAEDAEEGS